MTATVTDDASTDELHVTVARHNPNRWRLSRAGFVDVWQYYDNEFDLSAGRGILRGPNGSGKSRALEMLLPFLLDADRRNLPTATPVTLEDLMARGIGERTVRQGHMWLELRRLDAEGSEHFYTLGACLRYSTSSRTLSAHYWTTNLRVGHELALTVDNVPLSRADLLAAIGADRVTDRASEHRERVRVDVFGLTGESGKERFDGLLRLLHTLRDPGVGDRIESGALPQIVSHALPPLSEMSLVNAGQALDNLTSTREDLERMRQAHQAVEAFLEVYRRWLTGAFATLFDKATVASVQAVEKAKESAKRAGIVADLEAQIARAKDERDGHGQAAQAATAAADTLKSSPQYKALTELSDKRQALTFAKSAASGALKAAADMREVEAKEAAAADTGADTIERELAEVNTAATAARQAMAEASLHGHEIPASVTAHRRPGPAGTDSVRDSLDGDPVTLTRPVADILELAIVPADVAAAAQSGERAADARRASAGARASDAARIEREQQQLAADQGAADSLAEVAVTAEADAGVADDERDAAARELASAWATWTELAATREVLGPIEWNTIEPVAQLLADPDVLFGDWAEEPMSFARLAGAASAAAEPARAALADERARVQAAQLDDDEREAGLRQARQRLTDEHDEPPATPPWQQLTGTALWQVTEFAPQMSSQDRAGVEAALTGAGALTATIDATGVLVADDGHLLLTPGTQAPTPLTAWLSVDVAACAEHGMDPAAVTAVLAGIGAGVGERTPDSPALAVGVDGSWRNGLLRGRHPVTHAGHIGAAARAAARAARIVEIDEQLNLIAAARAERKLQLTVLAGRGQALADHISGAPAATLYTDARARALTNRSAAFRARESADAKQATVSAKALALRSEREQHKLACDAADLPLESHELRAVEQVSTAARNACRAIPPTLKRLAQAQSRWQTLLEQVLARTRQRSDLEEQAHTAWGQWSAANVAYRTLEKAVGSSGRDLQREVEELESKADREARQASAAAAHHTSLTGQHGSAQEKAASGAAEAATAQLELEQTTATVRARLQLEGVIDTLYIDPAKASAAREAFTDPAAAAADAEQLSAALRRARTGDTQLHAEERTFATVIGERFDLHPDQVDGIWLYRLSDSDGRRPLAAAASQLHERYEQDQRTLTERDTAIFTDYLLGEVGDELRRRIGQAQALIADMQSSLATIRTSHDVQVKVRWGLDEDAGDDIRATDKLLRMAQQLRNRDQDSELVRLLRERVMNQAATDPTAGFTEHLQRALDYRAWHRVEVLVNAPHIGTAKVSGKSKLSQGELRTVSYVTLFAAVDAYISSLGSERALRLALLDDAFAKVDANSIGQMMGLLVALDIDFVLTGHDLWGCFPTVPALDVYTILRHEDGPAVAQHTHWDGRGRHLRVP